MHIFECNPKKPINTAYYISRAVMKDQFPDHAQAREDYGFDRAFSAKNSSNLIGLYKGLILYLHVHPKTLHNWQVSGTLVENIKAAFSTLPENKRGGYYPWFLENQWVLDATLPARTADLAYEMMERGWRYAVASPTAPATTAQIQANISTWPRDNQACFQLCLMSGSQSYPGRKDDLWLRFGFCTCPDEYSEGGLGILYHSLMGKYTFSEILAAYKSSSLIALIDSAGLRGQGGYPHLADVLAGSGSSQIKSVWRLK